MMKLPTTEELFNAGAHFGHLKAKSHPKSKSAVFSIVNGVYIIDLDISRAMLEKAADYLKKQSSAGKTILLVGTKKQARESVEKAGKALGVPYVINKWLGGTLTNFTTIKLNLKKLEGWEAEKADPKFTERSKKAQATVNIHISKLHRALDGIKNLDKLPDVLFVVDINEEKTAITEARKLDIPVVGIVDTNADPGSIDYPIVVNDDSFKTVDLILSTITEAIAEGKKIAPKPEVETKDEK
jgi:small subunit ribosomal protein S2